MVLWYNSINQSYPFNVLMLKSLDKTKLEFLIQIPDEHPFSDRGFVFSVYIAVTVY